MDHTELIHETIKVADEVGCTLLRNETVVRLGANEQRFRGGLGKGSPDLVGFEPYYFGRFIGVECKVSDNIRKEQGQWLRALLINNGMVYVVRPDTLEEFRNSLILTAESKQPAGTPSKVDVIRETHLTHRLSFLDLPDMVRELPVLGKKFEYKLGAYHNVRLGARVWRTKR